MDTEGRITTIGLPGFAGFFVILVFLWFGVLVGRVASPPVPLPVITESEFLLRVEYSLDGNVVVLEDILHVHFAGTRRLIGETWRNWDWNLPSASLGQLRFNLINTDRLEASYSVWNFEYYMGMIDAERTRTFHLLIKDTDLNLPHNWDGFRRNHDDTLSYHFNTIESLFDAISLNYNITLIDWQPPTPIENTTRREPPRPFFIATSIATAIYITVVIVTSKKRKSSTSDETHESQEPESHKDKSST